MSKKGKDLIIPDEDSLVERKVSTINTQSYRFKNYLAQSGTINRFIHFMGEVIKVTGQLSTGTAIGFVCLWVMLLFFDLFHPGSIVAWLFFRDMMPWCLAGCFLGIGAEAAGGFLKNKSEEETLKLVALDEEKHLLDNGNYYRDMKSMAENSLDDYFHNLLVPLIDKLGELDKESKLHLDSRITASSMPRGPSKDKFLSHLGESERTTENDKRMINAQISALLEDKKQCQAEVSQVCAYADIIAVRQRRLAREAKDDPMLEHERRLAIEEIKDQIEDLTIKAEIDAGISSNNLLTTKVVDKKDDKKK